MQIVCVVLNPNNSWDSKNYWDPSNSLLCNNHVSLCVGLRLVARRRPRLGGQIPQPRLLARQMMCWSSVMSSVPREGRSKLRLSKYVSLHFGVRASMCPPLHCLMHVRHDHAHQFYCPKHSWRPRNSWDTNISLCV